MVTHDTTSLYKNNCATCHGDDLQGRAAHLPFPGRYRQTPHARGTRGRHPRRHVCQGFSDLGRNVERDRRLPDHRQGHLAVELAAVSTKDPSWQKYRNEGYILFRDPQDYPPLTPPWGTLNAIDLNKGEIRWQIPFGEYPDLVAKGLKNTGSDNYGGPVVTANGLLFIGATNFDKKFRAFDKLTGKLLWETVLPAAGNATPSIYEIHGRQYVVIVCGGGKNDAPLRRQHRRLRAAGKPAATVRPCEELSLPLFSP